MLDVSSEFERGRQVTRGANDTDTDWDSQMRTNIHHSKSYVQTAHYIYQ